MLLFKAFGTLIYIFKFIFSTLCFVPMLCSLIHVVNVMHFFKYITLVPLLDFISLMQLLWFLYQLSVGHANDTLH